MKWVEENPVGALKPPRFHKKPTLPFTGQEFESILTASGRAKARNTTRAALTHSNAVEWTRNAGARVTPFELQAWVVRSGRTTGDEKSRGCDQGFGGRGEL